MSSQASDSTLIFLRPLVLDAMLSGNSKPASIMKHIGLSGDENERLVCKLLNDVEFLREVEKAQEQIDERVIKWFKKRGLAYAERMHKLAMNDEDMRVSYQATKDALDRMGTGATQKLEVTGLDKYKALIESLQAGKETENGVQGQGEEEAVAEV